MRWSAQMRAVDRFEWVSTVKILCKVDYTLYHLVGSSQLNPNQSDLEDSGAYMASCVRIERLYQRLSNEKLSRTCCVLLSCPGAPAGIFASRLRLVSPREIIVPSASTCWDSASVPFPDEVSRAGSSAWKFLFESIHGRLGICQSVRGRGLCKIHETELSNWKRYAQCICKLLTSEVLHLM